MCWLSFVSRSSTGSVAWIARLMLVLTLFLGALTGGRASDQKMITIVTQPADQEVLAGQRATFKVAAQVLQGRLRYQWYRLGPSPRPGRGGPDPIPGATSPSYTTPVLGPAEDGERFFVLLKNGWFQQESQKARLTVRTLPPPCQPAVRLAQYVTAGAAGLKASTQPEGPWASYAWSLTNGTLTSGQGTPAITFTAGAAGTTLTASVQVTNPWGGACGSARAKIVPAPSADLVLPPSVHPGDRWMKASVPVQPDMACFWTVIPGTSYGRITAGQGTGIAGFAASCAPGTFDLQAQVQNRAGDSDTAARTVTVQKGTWLVENGGASTPRTGATATLLPGGRVLVAGGGCAAAEIYDPATGAWIPTGSLGTPRGSHTATLLRDGKVLVAGGTGTPGVALASAEIFDPLTQTWTSTGPLGTARTDHTATLLPGGKVLVAGGDAAYNDLGMDAAEVFDPSTGTWTPAAPMGTARQSHSATLMANGKVLVAGGLRASYDVLASAEIFDPSTGTWNGTGSLGTARSSHSATLLLDGRVLAAGGDQESSAEIYDPSKGTWMATGSLGTARGLHTATRLPDGTVLAAGGEVPTNQALASAERYDPARGTWAPTGSLQAARYRHTATLLQDGNVLVAGGTGNGTPALARAEVYTPSAGAWTTRCLGTPRTGQTATLLPDGAVLAAGGAGASAEIYLPALGTWKPTGSLGAARSRHTATLLPSGKVLVAGGLGNLATAELYDPVARTWTVTGSMKTGRHDHSATLLRDGTVLVAGGFGMDQEMIALSAAEIYDPATGAWTSTGNLGTARGTATATLLRDGTVLVAGGAAVGNLITALPSSEIYDPRTGTFAPAADMGTARADHTATLLADGTVLVAGGDVGSNPLGINQAERYDPVQGTWTATAPLGTARTCHTATLLPDGRVLVAGGRGQGDRGALANAEIFTPGTGTWAPTGSLEAARERHSAVLLRDGTVLAAFGDGGDVVTEIYMP